MSQSQAATRYCPQCGESTAEAFCPTDGATTILRGGFSKDALSYQEGDVVARRYRITGILGRGGYGAVYAGVHTGTQQAVAIKVLTFDPAAEGAERLIKRFYKEAQITAGLQAPNTVRVFDVGQDEAGPLYIAMEMLRGPSLERVLASMLKKGISLTEAQAIDLALPMLKSLGEAHGKGLVHRDIKPANVILAQREGEEEPIVKVLDFGIARTRDSSLTTEGAALGTPKYMAPEQSRGKGVDGRADLYSLGVMLYACVTGRLPFEADDLLSLMFMHNHEPVPDPRTMTDQPLSDPFVDILHKSMAKAPDERFDDAKAMRHALEAARGGAWAGTPLGPGEALPEDADESTLERHTLDRPKDATLNEIVADVPAAQVRKIPKRTQVPALTGSESATEIAEPVDQATQIADATASPKSGASRLPIIAGLAVVILGVGAFVAMSGGNKPPAKAAAKPVAEAPKAPPPAAKADEPKVDRTAQRAKMQAEIAAKMAADSKDMETRLQLAKKAAKLMPDEPRYAKLVLQTEAKLAAMRRDEQRKLAEEQAKKDAEAKLRAAAARKKASRVAHRKPKPKPKPKPASGLGTPDLITD